MVDVAFAFVIEAVAVLGGFLVAEMCDLRGETFE